MGKAIERRWVENSWYTVTVGGGSGGRWWGIAVPQRRTTAMSQQCRRRRQTRVSRRIRMLSFKRPIRNNEYNSAMPPRCWRRRVIRAARATSTKLKMAKNNERTVWGSRHKVGYSRRFIQWVIRAAQEGNARCAATPGNVHHHSSRAATGSL